MKKLLIVLLLFVSCGGTDDTVESNGTTQQLR